jgi:hypothetical protein
MEQGLAIARKLVDLDSPEVGSSLHLLAANSTRVGVGTWTSDDLLFLDQALRGLAGVETAQLDGLLQMFGSSAPIHLHPSMTVIRGMAEASGLILWLLEPWIAPLDSPDEIAADEWLGISAPILSRSQLVLLETLFDRKKRHGQEKRDDGVRLDEERIAVELSRIRSQHGPDDVVLTGDRRQWSIEGQQIPNKTDRVKMATEFSYGQAAVGSGMNPHPMLSGYAHASLDVVFAYTQQRQPITDLLVAPLEEVKLIASLALRLHASTYEVSAKAFGVDLADFTQWDARVEEFVLGD